MTAEIKEIYVQIGKSYREGNSRKQKGEPVFIKVEPTVQYFDVVDNEHTPMEFDPRTGESAQITIPQF